jgi:hypothetical protein
VAAVEEGVQVPLLRDSMDVRYLGFRRFGAGFLVYCSVHA